MQSKLSEILKIKVVFLLLVVFLFPLPALAAHLESFESGDLSVLPWVTGGDGQWEVNTLYAFDGDYSAQSPPIGDLESSYLELTADFYGGEVSFFCRMDSEPDHDFLRFYIDGVEQGSWAGSSAVLPSYQLSAGIHTLRWAYEKDFSANAVGEDLARLDYITLPLNLPPTISGTSQSLVKEGVFYSFIPVADDPDGDTLTFSIVNQPPWASFNTVTGELSGTPAVDDVGLVTSDIMISVSDGTAPPVSLPGFDLEVVTPVAGEAKLVPGDGGTGYDYFGNSVSISGDFAIVGKPLDDAIFSDGGSAYIYQFNGSEWVEQQKLTNSDGANYDTFGWSVSISGNYAVVGAQQNDENGNNSGAAYIYFFDGNNWIEQQKLTASDGVMNDRFGTSVAIKDGVVIVGASSGDGAAADSGAAYIFTFDGSSWVEQQKLVAADGDTGDFFGAAVAIEADYAVVGAKIGDGNVADSGAAYVFAFNGASWVEQQKLIASDGDLSYQFGSSVSINGNNIIVGSPTSVAQNNGAAYIFTFNGTDWYEEQILTVNAPNIKDNCGKSVSINGKYALVGVEMDSTSNGNGSGAAFLFYWDGMSWVEDYQLIGSDTVANDHLGCSAALQGDRIILGACTADVDTTKTGAAYIYSILAPLNDPPVISGIPEDSATQDNPYSFMPAAADPDGDPIYFSIVNKPAWAIFDLATGELSGIPASDDIGIYSNIVISVSDGVYLPQSLPPFDIEVLPSPSGSQQWFSTDVPVTIVDEAITISTLEITSTATIYDLNIGLNISHTYDGDLTLNLIAPDGRKVTLSNRNGADGDGYIDTLFDDEGDAQLAFGNPPYTGSYIPENGLYAFDGIPANGTWTLEVIDHAFSDTGTLNSWFLEITTDPITPLNDTTEFVKQVYSDFLNRYPDQSGLYYWVNGIDGGSLTRGQCVENFLLSAEFGGNISPVTRLYFAYFLRIPDYAGLMYWIGEYNGGMPLNEISENFAQSAEFVNTYGSLSNSEFVTLVYQNVLERDPEQAGLDFWTGELDAGNATRGEVMTGFSESAEYLNNSASEIYVTMTYIGLLRRAPDQGGYDYWVSVLDGGGSGLGLIDGFLDSQEYVNRF